MCSDPTMFQCLVKVVLAGLTDCNAYLVDLIVYTAPWEEHLQVFLCLIHALLTQNLAQCEFRRTTITYLDWGFCNHRMSPSDHQESSLPFFFFGMAGYYRNFCWNSSFFLTLSVVYPLTHLLSPKAHFVWSPERQYALQKFKSLLPILQPFPIFLGPLKLEVAASMVHVGAILQEDPRGADHPVSYFF